MKYESKASSWTATNNFRFLAISTLTAASVVSLATPTYINAQDSMVVKPIYDSLINVDNMPCLNYVDLTSTYDETKEKEEILERYIRLEKIESLSENWDGCGAKIFDKKLINVIRKLIPCIIEQPEIFPTGRNTIQLEYDGSCGDYLEIEVICENVANVYMIKNDTEKEFDISPTAEKINKLLEDFYG